MGTPTTASAEENRSIESTLKDMLIDKDNTPEEAASAAASDVASSVVVGETETVQVPPAVDVGADSSESKEIPPESSEESLPVPLEESVAPLVPSPKPQRSRKRETPKGAAGKVGKALAAKVPGAESVKVYKRKEDGQKWYLRHYTASDLASHEDFESFLTQYIKPKYGAGEYVLTAPDSRDPNKEFELGTVRLMGEPTAEGGGMMGVMQTLLAQNQSRDADWQERMEKQMQQQPQQNPIDLLKGVMEVSEKVNGKAGASEAAAQAQAASTTQTMMEVMQASGDKTTQMMMMMMNQQQQAAQQQQQMMMTLLAKPKEEDPLMKILMAKMFEDGGPGGGGAALQPPPPPPPPQDNTVALITALGGFMAAMGGGGEGGGDDAFKEYLIAQQTAKAGESLSTKDIIELVTRKDVSTGDGFKDAVDNMAAIMNITQNVSRQNEGGPAAGLFDAMAALFSNRDFAGAIANTIRARTDQSGAVQKTGIDMAQQRLAHQQRLALQQQQQALLVQQQTAAAGVPAAAVTPPPTSLGSVGVPPAPATSPSPITGEQLRQAEVAAQQRQSPLPQLPSDTHTHLNKIAAAEDDAQRVERTVRMLIYFSEFSDWRVFIEQLLGYIRDGDREGTVRYLGAFIEGFISIHLMDPTLGKEILRTMIEHFGALQEHLRDFELTGDDVVTGDDLLQSPEGVVVPIDGRNDDSGENHDDPGENDDPGGEDGGDGSA